MWFSEVCTLIDNDTRHHSGHSLRAGSLICKGIADKEKNVSSPHSSRQLRRFLVFKQVSLLAGYSGQMLWTHEAPPSKSTTNFDHRDDVYRWR